MIALVTGPPGAGKTYWCVRQIAEALDAGKVVVTNVGLRPDWAERLAGANAFRRLIPGRRAKVAADYRRRLHVIADLDELLRVRVVGTKEGRAVAVLDEAHRWMNARAWKDEGRSLIVAWASAHRHYGFDVYLVTQDALNIDRQVRDLFEYHIRLKNLRKFKVAGVPLFPFNLFIAIWGWHDGAKSIVKRQTYRLTRMARLYETHALAQLDVPDDVILLPAAAPELTPERTGAMPLIRPDLERPPAADCAVGQAAGADLTGPAPATSHDRPAAILGPPARSGGSDTASPSPVPAEGRHAAAVGHTAHGTTPSGWLAPLGDAVRAQREPSEPEATLVPVPLPVNAERPPLAPASAPKTSGASPPHGPGPG